jgi:hypothetical protein
MLSVRRSSGDFGGLPIRLFSIKLNIPIKSLVSTIASRTNYGYDKYRQNKTPVKPWRVSSGRIIRLVAESS